MTIADPKQFTIKNKIMIYIRVFVKLYNYKNRKKVYEFYKIVLFEKLYNLTTKNFYYFSAY